LFKPLKKAQAASHKLTKSLTDRGGHGACRKEEVPFSLKRDAAILHHEKLYSRQRVGKRKRAKTGAAKERKRTLHLRLKKKSRETVSLPSPLTKKRKRSPKVKEGKPLPEQGRRKKRVRHSPRAGKKETVLCFAARRKGFYTTGGRRKKKKKKGEKEKGLTMGVPWKTGDARVKLRERNGIFHLFYHTTPQKMLHHRSMQKKKKRAAHIRRPKG